MTVTAANLSPEKEVELSLVPFGFGIDRRAEISLLGDGDLHAHNTFDEPERVKVRHSSEDSFDGIRAALLARRSDGGADGK